MVQLDGTARTRVLRVQHDSARQSTKLADFGVSLLHVLGYRSLDEIVEDFEETSKFIPHMK